MRPGIVVRLLTVAGACTALAACATPQPGGAQATQPAPVAGAGERPYDCNGRRVDPVAFAAAQPAASLPEPQVAIVESAIDDLGEPIGVDPAEWIVADMGATHIALMRELEEGEPALDPGHGWKHIVISRMDSQAWMLTSSATCAVTYDLTPLTSADIALDPDNPPDPASREVALLVTERACNSGRDAEGRVRLVELHETGDAVTVTIGVDRSGMDGAYACPGNPPTPFIVTLQEPLGDRAILNGNLVVPRPIESWDAADW